jgi:hypothetical protein
MARKDTLVPHRRLLLALTLLLLSALVPLGASAAYYDTFPIQPGFSHPAVPPDTGAGLPLAGGGAAIRRGSPTIAEIDGNAGNGKEIAVGGNDGMLYVYHKNGTPVWAPKNVLPSGCTYNTQTDGVIHTAPAVGKLFGDSTPYVVVTYGTIQASNCDGGVAVYNGATGALEWRFSLRAWQASQGYKAESLYGAVSSPAVADTDFDGDMEIGFGGLDRNVYLLDADGSVRWYYHAADTVWSSPAFANVDSDADLEMVIGTDISANSRIKPPTTDGGFVYAFDTQPRAPKRIEFRTGYLWQSINFDQAIYSSPTITDLDGDGSKEVIIGSGCYFSPASLGHWIKILNSGNGAVIRTLNTSGCLSSSPAVGDIDGDGKLEIVANVNGATVGAPGRVQAWDYDNPTAKWTIDPRDSLNNNDPYIDDIQSPVLADLDGNGSLEVIVANVADVVVLRGSNGQQLTCRGCVAGPGNAMFSLYTVKSTPAVGDIDGDGDLEVVIGGSGKNGVGAYLYAWTDFAGLLGSSAGPLPGYSAPWPTFRGNPAHTGVYIPPALRTSTAEIVLLVESGASTQTVPIEVKDVSDGVINWTATKDQSWISLSDSSGKTPDTIDVTIDPSGKPVGSASTGSITFDSSFGKPAIDVTLRVVDEVFAIYLPVTRR